MLTRQGSIAQGQDRRSKPRICVPFHASVDGIDDHGEHFNMETVLDNISGDGLYLRLMPCVQYGARLSIIVGLNASSERPTETARFSIDGVVKRVEKKAGGACGVAVTFDHAHVL